MQCTGKIHVVLMKTTNLYFPLALVGCLLLYMSLAAQGFMWIEHEEEEGRAQPVLIDKVHAPHWDITYTNDCPPPDEKN